MYYLEAQHDARKSFYKKAYIETQKNDFEQTKDLYSYNTLVASVVYNFDKNCKIYNFYGRFSQTTSRHQKEFFKQEGLDDKQIKKLLNADAGAFMIIKETKEGE